MMLRNQVRSSKNKKQRFPFFGCFMLLIMIVAFVGIGGGFYYVINGNPFEAEAGATPMNILQQLGSDATPILATNTAITPDSNPNSQTFRDIMTDLNAVRTNAGLTPLSLNSQLNSAAAVQAIYNSEILQLSHDSANGDDVSVRVSAQGYQWSRVGENLLANWTLDGREAFELWRDSPSHNANMMNEDFTEIGLAYIVLPSGQVYQAMVLARPR